MRFSNRVAWPAVLLLAAWAAPQATDARVRLHRALDLRPPDVALEVQPGTAAGTFVVRVRAADRSGVAKVFLSVDGDVVSARVDPPFVFRVAPATIPAEICAVADDRFGNSGRACRLVGPVCLVNGDCAAGEFCRLPVGACFGDLEGVCQARPQACTTDFNPVCGCDGQEYGNLCEAHAAGVNVASRGPCPD